MNKEEKRIVIQVLLFVTTFITTTIAGAELCFGRTIWAYDPESITGLVFNAEYSWDDFFKGLSFSVPLLLFLTAHEFGHYFTAIYHKVKSSLPYYLPFPPIPIFLFNIGTLGAVIRFRSRPESNVQFFDIGLAGPLAGFVVSIAILFYGFATLPEPDYIYQFHPEYKQYGANYADHVYTQAYFLEHKGGYDVTIGKNLIFLFFENFVTDPSRIPNPHELMHYPVLLAGLIALLFTCLNLFPIGQLDGGHVVYGLFGFKRHKIIASVFFIGLLFYSGLGLEFIRPAMRENWYINIPLYILFLYFAMTGLRLSKRDTAMYAVVIFAIHFILAQFVPGLVGYSGWLLFVGIVGRFVGVQHPQAYLEYPLDGSRVVLGWITLIVFVLCFSPSPLNIEVFMGPQ